MNPIQNVSLIRNRLAKVAATPPKAPLKGHGNVRVELGLPHVFELIKKHAPAHCEVVTSRERVNRFGKLGFVGHNYVSPELNAVLMANASDFAALDKALALVSNFSL